MHTNSRIILILALCTFVISAKANDTLLYTLQQCRELALSQSNSSKSQEETLLAAKYNRQAALAAMFPRITANASYTWNSRDAHLIANQMEFPFGTVTATEDGTPSFHWKTESTNLAKTQETSI